jgi:hypothetical protein
MCVYNHLQLHLAHQELRAAACWKGDDEIYYIGTGTQHGTPGVWGFGENDGAAQW